MKGREGTGIKVKGQHWDTSWLSYHRWWRVWRGWEAAPSHGTWTSRARHTGTAGSSPPWSQQQQQQQQQQQWCYARGAGPVTTGPALLCCGPSVITISVSFLQNRRPSYFSELRVREHFSVICNSCRTINNLCNGLQKLKKSSKYVLT